VDYSKEFGDTETTRLDRHRLHDREAIGALLL
jgi:hypothetical protein